MFLDIFERNISPLLISAAQSFPVTVLTGPRQSGKTTLLKHLFPQYTYINLEAPDSLLKVKSDPRGYLASTKGPWIIDEAQRLPELFSYIQVYLDENNAAGQFILSGSQNFQLLEKISQTLAGRAAILELLPLTYDEFLSHKKMEQKKVWDYVYHGAYPRPYQENLDHQLWYNSYIRTYLERDVRDIMKVRDLSKFQLFLKLCAGRHGQLLNIESLAVDCGISGTAATQWFSILEASYICYRLRPYRKNYNKRLVKTPKLFFYDSAIVCHLLEIESPQHLAMHVSRGHIFEGFILSEIIKSYTNRGREAPVYFWRDHSGLEVDIIVERPENISAIEVKSGMTFDRDFLTSLKKWQTISGTDFKNLQLIYAGSEPFIHQDISILPWDNFIE